MKTAIYIEDGVTQLVLTPETATDKSVLDTIFSASRNDQRHGTFNSYRGEFYHCQGEWNRWGAGGSGLYDREDLSSQSLILRVTSAAELNAASPSEPDAEPESV